MEPAPEAPLLGRLLPMLQVLSLVCLAIAALGVIAVEGVWSGVSAVVALVVVDAGPRAGYLTALAVGVAGTMLHLTSGNGLSMGLMNALPIVVLLCFGVALGSALRAYHEAHARDLRTISERDRVLARLE